MMKKTCAVCCSEFFPAHMLAKMCSEVCRRQRKKDRDRTGYSYRYSDKCRADRLDYYYRNRAAILRRHKERYVADAEHRERMSKYSKLYMRKVYDAYSAIAKIVPSDPLPATVNGSRKERDKERFRRMRDAYMTVKLMEQQS